VHWVVWRVGQKVGRLVGVMVAHWAERKAGLKAAHWAGQRVERRVGAKAAH
jgi:hypothetical protein